MENTAPYVLQNQQRTIIEPYAVYYNISACRIFRYRRTPYNQLLYAMNYEENDALKGGAESELHEAAWAGDLEWVRKVVEEGAKINWCDSAGETALFGACGWGRLEVIRYLLANDASVNIQEKNGLTPLHWAASHGGVETMKLLIKAGADPTITDNSGRLPIDVAHNNGKGEHVAYLKTVGPPIKSRRK